MHATGEYAIADLWKSSSDGHATVYRTTGRQLRSGTMVYEEKNRKWDRLARSTPRNIRTRLWSLAHKLGVR